MPIFKGLAVSVHIPNGPLPEYSIQKNSRAARISSYIPVPPPKVPEASTTGALEQSTFAISITLLVPNQRVPYSAPKPSADNYYPQGKLVGQLPASLLDQSNAENGLITPYVPRTTSPNETLAAYIYFDGRPKEEVATLLRKGEETWVNSRWVSIPQSEGGGLAEREFLFREVGLERWLNGLDLVGKEQDKAATIEKRHKKLQRRNQANREGTNNDNDGRRRSRDTNGVLRYGENGSGVVDEEDISLSDSDDEPPDAEAAGQIKVALFRVLASGDIKRGEYEAQFDANDDAGEQNDGGDAEIEHTTSFAKPKSLDPKSISTQTVTGLDPADSPYAVFTFFYRGDKQLRKMGMLDSPKQAEATPSSSKRKSTDFSKLGPLNKFGTVGFTGYRDQNATPKKKDCKADDDDMMDSDKEDEDPSSKPADEDEDTQPALRNGSHLSPADAHKQGELSEGVRKIKLKRAHSSEPVNDTRKSPHLKTIDSPPSSASQSGLSSAAVAGSPPADATSTDPSSLFASPFKKHRASMEALDNSFQPSALSKETSMSPSQPNTQPAIATAVALPSTSSEPVADAASSESAPSNIQPSSLFASQPAAPVTSGMDEDEEL